MAGPTRAIHDPKDKPNQSARTRRQYSAEEKVRLLKLHLVDGQPISAICDVGCVSVSFLQRLRLPCRALAVDDDLRIGEEDAGLLEIVDDALAEELRIDDFEDAAAAWGLTIKFRNFLLLI